MRKLFPGIALAASLLWAFGATAQVISGQGASSSSSNITQWNGNTVVTGNGTTSAGTLQVTISSDSTGQVKLATGANTVGKVDILGNAGATLDGTVAAGSAPTNALAILGQYNTSLPSLTAAQTAALQTDSSARLLIGSIASALPAGTNILGKVGIDQTTAVTTNGVVVAPTTASAAGITPTETATAATFLSIKGSAGNLYSVYATSGATGGFLLMLNSASSSYVTGTVTPVDCVQLPANTTVALSSIPGPPDAYATGILAEMSTTGCFTATNSATAGFIKGKAV